jgi:hypothetical protein
MLSIGRNVPMRLATILALSTLACSQNAKSTTEIVPVGQPPLGGISESAQVPVGVIVGFSVVASGAAQGDSAATVDDPAIVSLVPTSIPGTYVLVGRSRGTTTLHATAGDAEPTTMPVEVFAQGLVAQGRSLPLRFVQ